MLMHHGNSLLQPLILHTFPKVRNALLYGSLMLTKGPSFFPCNIHHDRSAMFKPFAAIGSLSF